MAEPSKSLRHRVIELEEFGRKCGLSDADVKKCIERALQTEDGSSTRGQKRKRRDHGVEGNIKFQEGATSHESGRNVARLSLRKILIIALCCAVVGSFAFGVSIQYKCVRKFAMINFHKFMRIVRRGTLPVHNKFNISYYFDEECFVENPFYVKPDQTDCMTCDEIPSVKLHGGGTPIEPEALARPLLIKNYLPRRVDFRAVARVVRESAARMDVPYLKWHSSAPWLTTVLALTESGMEEKIGASPNFYLQWKCPSLAVGYKVRQLFPKSPDFAKTLSMSLDKTVILHGPAAKPFFLGKTLEAFTIYMQGSGTSRIHLRPPQKCRGQCLLLDVVLEERDIVIFPTDTYEAEVFPQGEGIHVGYLTYFS